jgi:tripartite-type tricarboxylate transporter receptor subunit TctC
VTTRLGTAVLGCLLAVFATLAAPADNYPSKPIHLITPWPPGGVADIGTRRLAARMEEVLGQQVVVENKPGASGQIGALAVARAARDGYTLIRGDMVTHALNVAVFPTLAYDPVKDFAPISLVGKSPMLPVANASLGVSTVQQLVALSKSTAGGLNYASASIAGPQHIAAELLRLQTGAAIQAVTYKGEGPALIDVVAGQVPFMFVFPAPAIPHIQSGKLRALCVTDSQRLPVLPDVPTVQEIGFPELEIMTWAAEFAPAGTPRPVVDTLNRAVVTAMANPQMREQLKSIGTEVVTSRPEELGAFVKSEIVRVGDIVKRAGIRLE